VIDAEYAFYTADDAAHSAPYDRTDGTGNLPAFLDSVRNPARDALSARRKRQGERCGEYAADEQLDLHFIISVGPVPSSFLAGTLVRLNKGHSTTQCRRG
jgi:hypothetical protein